MTSLFCEVTPNPDPPSSPLTATAFRSKIREDAVAARDISDPAAYEQHNTLATEIATILRKNVVQATRLGDSQNTDTWSEPICPL